MPLRLEACFYVDEAPEFEHRDGLFHITQTIGGYRFERVMRPHVFMQLINKAIECAREHHAGAAKIIDFPEAEGALFKRVYPADKKIG